MDASAEEPAPELPAEKVNALAANFKAIYEKADLDTRRYLLRSLIDHVDAEREDNLIRGIIWFYYPPTLPEDGAVSSSHGSPGALRYKHSVTFPFIVFIIHQKKPAQNEQGA